MATEWGPGQEGSSGFGLEVQGKGQGGLERGQDGDAAIPFQVFKPWLCHRGHLYIWL